MLTKEQEQKIRNAVELAWDFSALDRVSVYRSIVAGIKAYDEMKDVEDVKAAVNEEKAEKDNDSGAYCVVFCPNDGSDSLVFDSLKAMYKKMKDSYEVEIGIDEEGVACGIFKDYREVYLMVKEGDFWLSGESIGYCDCKTFKRG